MRVVTLGATGWLGRYARAELGALPGGEIIALGRRAAGSGVDLATVGEHQLAALLRRLAPDAVVNCAGRVGGSAAELIGANARGPAVLCAALHAAAPAARLVHLGSAAEYGAVPAGTPIGEDAVTSPQALYGAAKLAGSLAVTGSGLDAVVLRVFNVVGPGAPDGSLPGRLRARFRTAPQDGVIRTGPLSAHRDYVDPRDIARAIALALVAPGPLPLILNIAGGAATPVRRIAEGLALAAGFRGRIEEAVAGGSARSSFVPWQQADISAAAEALGWRPEIALSQSLKDLWAG